MTDEGKITSALVPSILESKVLYLKSCSYVDSKSLPIDQSDFFRFFEDFKKFLTVEILILQLKYYNCKSIGFYEPVGIEYLCRENFDK